MSVRLIQSVCCGFFRGLRPTLSRLKALFRLCNLSWCYSWQSKFIFICAKSDNLGDIDLNHRPASFVLDFTARNNLIDFRRLSELKPPEGLTLLMSLPEWIRWTVVLKLTALNCSK